MADNPAPLPAQQPFQITVAGSAAAPFLYFDAVATLGHFSGIMQIELVAQTVVPDGPNTKTELVAVAHLRCTFAGMAALKDAIQKIETMLAPSEGKAN
jgi:hypothetical protein